MSVSKLCFICFGEASKVRKIPLNAKKENGSGKDFRRNGVAGKFANSICEYLHLRHPKHAEETGEENFGFVCGVCEPLLREFCGMHEKLLEVQKKMNGKLEEISEVMRKAERENERKEEFEAYEKCLQLQQKRHTGKAVDILGFRKEFLKKVKIPSPEADSDHSGTRHHTSSNAVPVDPKVLWSNEAATSKSPSTTVEIAQKSLDSSASETDKPPLRQHASRQGNRKASHHCIFCGKYFSNTTDLRRHILSHIKEKPYNCKTCNAGFSRKQDLLIHRRRHAGKKPYKCEICDKRFVRSDALNNHIRVHTLEKPHKCQVCRKEFGNVGNCKRHEKIHRKRNPKCDEN